MRGELGDLLLMPMLGQEQFDAQGKATLHTLFAERRLAVSFQNMQKLDFSEYQA